MKKTHIAIISLVVAVLVFSSPACQKSIAHTAVIPVGGEEFISIFNRVDELLDGDLKDTISLEELRGQYLGKEIIGLGTTLREPNGEILFLSGNCYWADPTNDGRVTKLNWTEEELPFCAIAEVNAEDCLGFTGIKGDIHQWIESKMKELGITLAAVKVEGKFEEVRLSVAYRLPENPGEKLRNVFVTINEGKTWEFVGFYAGDEGEQSLLSMPPHSVHLHGKMIDNSHGGHLQNGDSVTSEVTIYPINEYILRNTVPF